MDNTERVTPEPQPGSGGAAPGKNSAPRSPSEMVIFTRTFDFLAWLLPHTNRFPRAHRHSLTRRLLDAALDLREHLEEANLRRGAARLDRLARADEALAKIRLHLRLATQLKWQTPDQYHHAFRMLAEIGRLLGGWTKGG